MPDTGYFEATGYGSMTPNPGGFIAMQTMVAILGTVTNPKVRILGETDPRIVQFGGSIGAGSPDVDTTGAAIDTINFTWVLNRTPMAPVVETLWWSVGAAYIEKVYWWLPPGISWFLKVEW